MTLAMTLGMSIGVRRTLWMMWGEVIGVACVAISAVIGVSAIMLKLPLLFSIVKFLGAFYLFYIGINMWRSKGKLALSHNNSAAKNIRKRVLFSQGFITAIANPKGWAFMISLLPPFINTNKSLVPQLSLLVVVIMISELVCMLIYATGGKTIGRTLTKSENVKTLNKISGTLMIAVAFWLALG